MDLNTIGLKIGFKDSKGIELAVGDVVKISRKIPLPNQNGYGRTLANASETQYQTDIENATIFYDAERAEFRMKIEKWTSFNLYQWDEIEKIEI